MNLGQLTTILVGTIITALLTAVGYSIKTAIDRLAKQADRIELRLDSVVKDVADMKPKVNALWAHFLSTNKKP